MTVLPDNSQSVTLDNVLVLGSGGREHALCWKLSQSPRIGAILCAPGNAGTAQTPKTQNIAISVMDTEEILECIALNNIHCVIIGPENPLAGGLVDILNARGIRAFGPTKAAAQLESSKAFAKEFMARYQLPTARFEVCNTLESALACCRDNDWARVIKADGLALGKGVVVCDSWAECEATLIDFFTHNKLGEAGQRVVIEEKLRGPEVSLLLFCDGEILSPCQLSQDYKRRYENNAGPNTGGMGSFSPVAWAEPTKKTLETAIIQPLQNALQQHAQNSHDGFTYKGMLFVGVMFDEQIRPHILEFNCRFGDPETQSLMPLLTSDLYDTINACIDGTLTNNPPEWSKQHAVCVVITASDYPEKSSQGELIQLAPHSSDYVIFHAGSVIGEEGLAVTRGGRVLNAVGIGETHDIAIDSAYNAVSQCYFNGMGYRSDIGKFNASPVLCSSLEAGR